MADLVNQNSVNPTNKLTAAMIGTLGWAITKAFVTNFFPEFNEPYLWEAALPVFVGLPGYFSRDTATTVVVQEVVATEIEVDKAPAQ